MFGTDYLSPGQEVPQFDVMAEAPDGGDRLRELILQLAVRDPGGEFAQSAI